MYRECLKCKEDVSHLMTWDTIGESIECPKCGNHMTVCYDESYDDDTQEDDCWWWLEQDESIRFYKGTKPDIHYVSTNIEENDGFIDFLKLMDPTLKEVDKSEIEEDSTINIVTKDDKGEIVVEYKTFKDLIS